MRTAKLVQMVRIAWYRGQWTCAHVHGAPRLIAPALLVGSGGSTIQGRGGPWLGTGAGIP
jgi:hypothetical protein